MRDYSLALAALTGALLASPAIAASTATPIEVAIPFAPTPVTIGGRARLFYELHLTSYGTARLDELEIVSGDDGATLDDAKGAALDPLLLRPGLEKGADAKLMAKGTVAVVFMETSLPAGRAAPASLIWRLHASKPDVTAPSLGADAPIEGRVAVSRRAPPVLAYPFGTGDWVAANGPSNTSGHRRTVLVVDGRARISQRFAIDWVKLGEGGKLFHGDKALNPSWYGFGTPILAVADATVSATHDGVPENEPSDKRAVPITLETVGGNYVILDLGGGRFAFYAHLQPGSLKVKVGDNVRRGQLLALLGNTGNSDAPHLHFHVSDANSPLGAEGLPYVFESFQDLGKAPFDQIVAPAGWKAGAPATIRRGEIPGEDAVVRIP